MSPAKGKAFFKKKIKINTEILGFVFVTKM